MTIYNKGAFGKGALLLASFCVVFAMIMSPMFKDHNGKAQTGLEFADDFFNKLSKNSSDYFDQAKQAAAKEKGKQIAITAVIAKPDPKVEPDDAKAQAKANKDAQDIGKVLQSAGATVEIKDNSINIKGDLGAMLEYGVTKAQRLFPLIGAEADKPENINDRKQLKLLWQGFGAMIKPLQKELKVAEAKALDSVMKKGLEPAYNFYGIPGEPVSQNIFLLTFLLSFYVVYTMWYGYGIFFLFEGIGLSMKKSKKKH